MARLFPAHGLYAITDGVRDDLLAAVTAALRGGAAAVQYRDTTQDAERRLQEAQALAALCHQHDTPLIIEADIALALASHADGVHVHTLDAIPQARATLGAQAVVGFSARNSALDAKQAAALGANYVSFGVCFASPTLPQARPIDHAIFSECADLAIPKVAIGGITADNGGQLIAAGADVLAAISGVFSAPDIETAAHAYLSCF